MKNELYNLRSRSKHRVNTKGPETPYPLPNRFWVESPKGGWYSLDRTSERGKQAIREHYGNG